MAQRGRENYGQRVKLSQDSNGSTNRKIKKDTKHKKKQPKKSGRQKAQ